MIHMRRAFYDRVLHALRGHHSLIAVRTITPLKHHTVHSLSQQWVDYNMGSQYTPGFPQGKPRQTPNAGSPLRSTGQRLD